LCFKICFFKKRKTVSGDFLIIAKNHFFDMKK
jgi:hypothetical protein